MVQVLPYVPTFGEKLLPVLAEAGNQFAQNLERKNARTALEKMYAQPTGNQAGSPMDRLNQANMQAEQLSPQKLRQLYELESVAYSPEQAKLSHEARLEQQKLASKEAVQSRKEDTEAFKLTQDYREKLLDSYEGSKRTNLQLNRMKKLNEEDELTTPLMAKFSESLGIPLSVLANPESEEYQKLSQDLLSNITKYFGNRILQVEVENFLKTIPTLMNSKEGRERIIENMQLLMKPQELAYEAYKDIRKKGGRIPLDLHEQVLEQIEPELDKLAEKFKGGSDMFNSLPSASKYKSKRIENEETGEIFISDGKEWKPYGVK